MQGVAQAEIERLIRVDAAVLVLRVVEVLAAHGFEEQGHAQAFQRLAFQRVGRHHAGRIRDGGRARLGRVGGSHVSRIVAVRHVPVAQNAVLAQGQRAAEADFIIG